jgi:hypothetical protein
MISAIKSGLRGVRRGIFGKGTAADIYGALARADRKSAAEEEEAQAIKDRVRAAEAAEDRLRAKARRNTVAAACCP